MIETESTKYMTLCWDMGKCTKTAISNYPCEFINPFRHTLDTLLSTYGHSIQNNFVYVINCYFKFDEKTRDHHY